MNRSLIYDLKADYYSTILSLPLQKVWLLGQRGYIPPLNRRASLTSPKLKTTTATLNNPTNAAVFRPTQRLYNCYLDEILYCSITRYLRRKLGRPSQKQSFSAEEPLCRASETSPQQTISDGRTTPTGTSYKKILAFLPAET